MPPNFWVSLCRHPPATSKSTRGYFVRQTSDLTVDLLCMFLFAALVIPMYVDSYAVYVRVFRKRARKIQEGGSHTGAEVSQAASLM